MDAHVNATAAGESTKHKPAGPVLVTGLLVVAAAHCILGAASLLNWEGRTYPDDGVLLLSSAALYFAIGIASRRSRTSLLFLASGVALAELSYSVLTPSEFLGSGIFVLPLGTAAFLGLMALPSESER